MVRWGWGGRGGKVEMSRMGWNGILARSCCCCATAHCHATAAAEPPSGQEKRGEEGREEGTQGRTPESWNHCSAAAGEGWPRGPVRDPQSPLVQTPLARATWRGDVARLVSWTMHNQHRSPDPTKIERATATSTVALFYFYFPAARNNSHSSLQNHDPPWWAISGAWYLTTTSHTAPGT